MTLRQRLERALFDADLFGITASPSPDRIAALVMHELSRLGEELTDAGREHYYEHRNRGPIEYAAGVEDTLCWLADLFDGVERPMPHQDWT